MHTHTPPDHDPTAPAPPAAPAPPVCAHTPSPKKAQPPAQPSGPPPQLPPAPAPTGGDSDGGGDSGSRCVRCCRVPRSNCPRSGPGGGGVASRPGGAALGTIGAGPRWPGGPGAGSGVRGAEPRPGGTGVLGQGGSGELRTAGPGWHRGGAGDGDSPAGSPGAGCKTDTAEQKCQGWGQAAVTPPGSYSRPRSMAWHGTHGMARHGTA